MSCAQVSVDRFPEFAICSVIPNSRGRDSVSAHCQFSKTHRAGKLSFLTFSDVYVCVCLCMKVMCLRVPAEGR